MSRALASRPDLRVLFASGYAETDALEAALGKPAQLIRKPFDTASLASKLAEVMANSARG